MCIPFESKWYASAGAVPSKLVGFAYYPPSKHMPTHTHTPHMPTPHTHTAHTTHTHTPHTHSHTHAHHTHTPTHTEVSVAAIAEHLLQGQKVLNGGLSECKVQQPCTPPPHVPHPLMCPTHTLQAWQEDGSRTSVYIRMVRY